VLLGALAVARSRVRIVTPYFLPDESLLAALKVTALRGVAVDIVLPERSNLRVMDWATRPQLPELLGSGCRIHLSPPLPSITPNCCWSMEPGRSSDRSTGTLVPCA